MQNKTTTYQIHKEYIKAEGLDKIIDFTENADFVEGPYDTVRNDLTIALPPDLADLVRLHQLVRKRRCTTVLEFGTGYSSAIIADALFKNEQEWQTLQEKPVLRNRYLFQLFTVDTSEKYVSMSKGRVPVNLRERIHFSVSKVFIGTFRDRLCHYYSCLPDIVPDFIYLDGPSPKDVTGQVNGLSFLCDERTVMAADLLLMEPTLLPGTFIVVDGRTNNARFLQRNFQREWIITWYKQDDVTTFELAEERLGKYNILGSDLMLEAKS